MLSIVGLVVVLRRELRHSEAAGTVALGPDPAPLPVEADQQLVGLPRLEARLEPRAEDIDLAPVAIDVGA